MNNSLATATCLSWSLVLLSAGCSHKADANAELQKAASTFQQAEPSQPPLRVISEPAQPVKAAPASETSPPAVQQLQQAMAAYKAGNLQDAVTRLQLLRATPTMSPQQRMALQDAIAAVMTEIQSLAEKGDARAQQALDQYERMQTSRRRPL